MTATATKATPMESDLECAAVSEPARAESPRERRRAYAELVVLFLGVVAIAAPTMLFVAQESWSTEAGSHGPIVLFTGLWLLWRQWPRARSEAHRPSGAKVAIALAVTLSFFILTRITQIIELEGYAMYACLVVVLYSVIGWSGLKQLSFPIVYLAFMFPPPETVIAALTLPMKMGLSQAAVSLLHALGYPIGGEGVRIYIAQYELLVAEACSGLNSIVALTALSLFYIYIRHQAQLRYAALLVLFIIPVALFANFIRVLVLILTTYYLGDAAAQGFLHNFAGITMFALALVAIYLTDEAVRPLWLRWTGKDDQCRDD